MRGRYPDVVGPAVIREHVLGLAEVARQTPLDNPVPTCPDWRLGDLIWHVIQVDRFWTHVIAERPAGPDSFEAPTRPPADELAEELARAGSALADVLEGLDPEEAAWSWSDDQTVGFTLRRQSHEAVVHHVDGRLTANVGLPGISPELAADGIDEMVGVMLTGVPEWGRFERGTGVIALRTRDTGDSWTLAFGRMIGTPPDSDTEYDLDALEPVDEPADTVVEGDAVALHLWLAGRGDLSQLSVDGDAAPAEQLRAVVADL